MKLFHNVEYVLARAMFNVGGEDFTELTLVCEQNWIITKVQDTGAEPVYIYLISGETWLCINIMRAVTSCMDDPSW